MHTLLLLCTRAPGGKEPAELTRARCGEQGISIPCLIMHNRIKCYEVE